MGRTCLHDCDTCGSRDDVTIVPGAGYCTSLPLCRRCRNEHDAYARYEADQIESVDDLACMRDSLPARRDGWSS